MRIFISWSGASSQKIATILKWYLEKYILTLTCFVSSENIRKGNKWRDEIDAQLTSADMGIVCFVPSNVEAPWIVYESGVLEFRGKPVMGIAFEKMSKSQIKGPISDLQHSDFTEAEFLRILEDIVKNSRGDSVLGDNNSAERADIRKLMDQFWNDMSIEIRQVFAAKRAPAKKAVTKKPVPIKKTAPAKKVVTRRVTSKKR
jgi:TIR domain